MRATRCAAALLLAAAGCGELTRPAVIAEQQPAEVSPLDAPNAGQVPEGGAGWAFVAAGRDRTCALDVTGRAWCWGAEGNAPLATGGATDVCWSTACVPAPALVRTDQRFRAIAVGALHACAIALDGSIWCWGDNARGQAGVTSPRLVGEPVRANAAGSFTAIAAGQDHSCAVRSDDVMLCWGGNDMGQLGRGTQRSDDVPMPVSGSLRFRDVAAGEERTCGITVAGEAWCFGGIWQYTLGGVEYSRRQPVPELVPGGHTFTQLSVGALTTCGVADAGIAMCWEANGFGQMGTASIAGSTTPRAIASAERYLAVTAGLTQSCGIDESRRGWCWGNNTFGQLGDPSVRDACAITSSLACSRVPVPVLGSLRFVQLSSGLGSHTCGITTLTNLYCWGLGNSGQLGLGDPAVQLRQAPALVRAPAGG